jgi:hypothetical protein
MFVGSPRAGKKFTNGSDYSNGYINYYYYYDYEWTTPGDHLFMYRYFNFVENIYGFLSKFKHELV